MCCSITVAYHQRCDLMTALIYSDHWNWREKAHVSQAQEDWNAVLQSRNHRELNFGDSCEFTTVSVAPFLRSTPLFYNVHRTITYAC